ncbi:DnaB-like helicase N-terminal domain-containing protein [Actinomycetes bacterium M1A6_2h]
MNALRALPDPESAADDTAPVAATAEELLAPDWDETPADLTDNPATDPAALLLCALMWSDDDTEARRITAVLTPDDFTSPGHQQLYPLIRDLIAAGAPHDPASVLGELRKGDRAAADDVGVRGHGYIPRTGAEARKGEGLRKTLTDITTAGASGTAATHYADLVLSESYRRSFHQAGQRLIQAAEEGPEEDLFEYMVTLGRRQRAATQRLADFRGNGNGTRP